MKIVSNNVKNALNKPTTQRKGRILVNNNYYDVFNVEYYADAYNEGNVIGNAIASQLDFDLPYMSKFDTFKYFDGVWTGSDYEYVDMGTFTVFDEKDEDEFNKHITAFDNLIKFNAPFQDVGGYPKTLFQELVNVCNQAGVELENINISNGDFQVVNNQFVSGENLKTVLKSICGISGTYAIIKNDRLVLQLKNETNEILDKSQHEPIIWKRRTYGINQVILGMADVEGEYVIREDIEDIEENGVHKLVINDNLFAYTQEKRNQLIDGLFNQVRGFGYIPYEMNCEWKNYWEIGDTITIDNIETIILRINGKSPKSLESTISAPAIIDSAVEYINNTDSIENEMKRTEIVVDKQNQIIQSLSDKIVEVSQTVTGSNYIVLENAYDGKLHSLSIKGQISLLFPTSEAKTGQFLTPSETLTPSENLKPNKGVPYQNDILFPSDTLYLKSSKLIIDDKEYDLDFDFLNYINNEICDEFIYEEGKCKIIRRVGINENGEMYKLEHEIKEPRKDIELMVKENSKISLKSFENVILTAKYLTKNEYTDQFATKVEVSSSIEQTTNSINLEVSKKLDGEDFNGANILLEINKDESTAQIKADKIKIEGYTTIKNNFKIDIEGNMEAENAKLNGILIGSTFKGNADNSSSLVIGSNDLAQSPEDGFLNLIDYDGKLRLSCGTRYKDSTLEQLSIYSPTAKFFAFISDQDDARVNANAFTAESYMYSPAYNGGSLESIKKNIQIYEENAVDIISNSDIYSYNLKTEKDEDRKHIGLVIGDEGGVYNTPEVIIAKSGDGIDLYSMISMAWKAIKEQQKTIEDLEKQIKLLKEMESDK